MSTTERVRFTIAVDADVYEAFADLAHSSGVSMSRCIGDWLRDTAEAAQMTTIRTNEVRKSHQEIFRDYIASIATQAQEMLSGESGSRWRIGLDGERVSVPLVDVGKPLRPASEQFYSALNPAGERVLLPVGKAFGRDGALVDVPYPPRLVIRGGKSSEKGKKLGRGTS